MKYWYDDATLDKTIMFYRKMDDSIIVFYFNGNVEEIKYNEDSSSFTRWRIFFVQKM